MLNDIEIIMNDYQIMMRVNEEILMRLKSKWCYL